MRTSPANKPKTRDVLAQLQTARPLFASYLRIRSLSSSSSSGASPSTNATTSPELASARADLESALGALAEGPAYIAAGPVHATPTKPGRAAVGLEYVGRVAALMPGVPWYAIGGIDLTNVDGVVRAGASRIAVVRAVLDAHDPAQAAADLLARLPAAPEAVCR